MTPAVGRASLVLSLALARLGRSARERRQTGRVASLVAEDGALLVDTDRGPVLLLVTWDARIHGPRGACELDDLRCGDGVQWTDDGRQSVVMIDDLHVG